MMSGTIEAVDVTNAWIMYLEAVAAQGRQGVYHPVVRVQNPVLESEQGRRAVEEFFADWSRSDSKVYPVRTVRTTIFPKHYAQRSSNAQVLADSYRTDYDRIRKSNPANKYGTYFGRIVDTQIARDGTHYDQLNDTIASFAGVIAMRR